MDEAVDNSSKDLKKKDWVFVNKKGSIEQSSDEDLLENPTTSLLGNIPNIKKDEEEKSIDEEEKKDVEEVKDVEVAHHSPLLNLKVIPDTLGNLSHSGYNSSDGSTLVSTLPSPCHDPYMSPLEKVKEDLSSVADILKSKAKRDDSQSVDSFDVLSDQTSEDEASLSETEANIDADGACSLPLHAESRHPTSDSDSDFFKLNEQHEIQSRPSRGLEEINLKQENSTALAEKRPTVLQKPIPATHQHPQNAPYQDVHGLSSQEELDHVPIMSRRWPTEDGGFLLVQRFRKIERDDVSTVSSSGMSDFSNFSLAGRSSRQRLMSDNKEKEVDSDNESNTSEYSITSIETLPVNMTVRNVPPGVRQYLHHRNDVFNSKLTVLTIFVLTAGLTLGIGHFVGSSQMLIHQRSVQDGQIVRLRSLQDELVSCVEKRKGMSKLLHEQYKEKQNYPKLQEDEETMVGKNNSPTPDSEENDIVDVVLEGHSLKEYSCEECSGRILMYSEFCNLKCLSDNTVALSLGEIDFMPSEENFPVPDIKPTHYVYPNDEWHKILPDIVEVIYDNDYKQSVVDFEHVRRHDSKYNSVEPKDSDYYSKESGEFRDENISHDKKFVTTDAGAQQTHSVIQTDATTSKYLPQENVAFKIGKGSVREQHMSIGKRETQEEEQSLKTDGLNNENEEELIKDYEQVEKGEVVSLEKIDEVEEDADNKMDVDDIWVCLTVSDDEQCQEWVQRKVHEKEKRNLGLLNNIMNEGKGKPFGSSPNAEMINLVEEHPLWEEYEKDNEYTEDNHHLKQTFKAEVGESNLESDDIWVCLTVSDDGQCQEWVQKNDQMQKEKLHISSETADTLDLEDDSDEAHQEGYETEDDYYESRTEDIGTKDRNIDIIAEAFSSVWQSVENASRNLMQENISLHSAANLVKEHVHNLEEKAQDAWQSLQVVALQVNTDHIQPIVKEVAKVVKRHMHSPKNKHKNQKCSGKGCKRGKRERHDGKMGAQSKKGGKINKKNNRERKSPKWNRKFVKRFDKDNPKHFKKAKNDKRLSTENHDQSLESKVQDEHIGVKSDSHHQKVAVNLNDDTSPVARTTRRKNVDKNTATHGMDVHNVQVELSDGADKISNCGRKGHKSPPKLNIETVLDSMEMSCGGETQCVEHHKTDAAKLLKEMISYRQWLWEQKFRKDVDEVEDFMEELEEFIEEEDVDDEDIEDLKDEFEDMVEDIQKTTKKFFRKQERKESENFAHPSNSKKQNEGKVRIQEQSKSDNGHKQTHQEDSNVPQDVIDLDKTNTRDAKNKGTRTNDDTTVLTIDMLNLTSEQQQNLSKEISVKSPDDDQGEDVDGDELSVGGDIQITEMEEKEQSIHKQQNVGAAYYNTDDWFFRRAQDRENKKEPSAEWYFNRFQLWEEHHHPNDQSNWYFQRGNDRKIYRDCSRSPWYCDWAQEKSSVTVWDLYKWLTDRFTIRERFRFELDDQINWFLRKP